MVHSTCLFVLINQEMTGVFYQLSGQVYSPETSPFIYQDLPPANWMPFVYNCAIFMNKECLQEDFCLEFYHFRGWIAGSRQWLLTLYLLAVSQL